MDIRVPGIFANGTEELHEHSDTRVNQCVEAGRNHTSTKSVSKNGKFITNTNRFIALGIRT